MAEREEQWAAYEELPLPEQRRPPADRETVSWEHRAAVLEIDGGRGQLRDEYWGRDDRPPDHGFWRESKLLSLTTYASRASEQDPQPLPPAWLVDALFMIPVLRGMHGTAPEPAESTEKGPVSAAASEAEPNAPEGPEALVRSVVATFRPYEHLGRLARVEARERDFVSASRKALLGDGHPANWSLHEQCFSDYVPILDLLHALGYVYAAAVVLAPDLEEAWQLHCRWTTLIWQGKVAAVREEMESSARAEAAEVAGAIRYLRSHGPRMDYPRYRQLGFPIMTSRIESLVNQVGRRLKGTEKFWSREGGEGMLELCAKTLSHTQPLDAFWLRRPTLANGFRPSKPRTSPR